MRNKELVNIISSRLLAIQNTWPMVQIYLFGSILKVKEPCSDIDILVVSTSERVPRQLRNDIELLNEFHPVDILFMTSNEEKQFMFIKEQEAVSVHKITQQNATLGLPKQRGNQ